MLPSIDSDTPLPYRLIILTATTRHSYQQLLTAGGLERTGTIYVHRLSVLAVSPSSSAWSRIKGVKWSGAPSPQHGTFRITPIQGIITGPSTLNPLQSERSSRSALHPTSY